MKYDYLIVGAGIYGAVLAEQLSCKKKKCLVIDKRTHIAGNCFTEVVEGIDIHKYGPHIFNTHKRDVWEYVNKFIDFNNYRHKGKAKYQGKVYSFPINLMTLQQVWGVTTPSEALRKLEEVRIPCEHPANMEEWCLSQIGPELYEMFIKHYSTKQWGRPPVELPATIVKRIPIRLNYNDDYYENAEYQGIPVGGYTQMIANMFGNTKIELGTDFEKIRGNWQKIAKHLVYCGPIDQFFDYTLGELEYRSLTWETIKSAGDFQGCSIMNYNDSEHRYTRVIEHQHFMGGGAKTSVVSWEYPKSWKETRDPYYPINDVKNNKLYNRYRKLANLSNNILISGRLGTYKYLDMDDAISLALTQAKTLQ